MRSDELRDLSDCALHAIQEVLEGDWSRPALGLDWTCWQTVDHLIDCLFSYTYQVAARAQSGFLPFNELHAQSGATREDLLVGLRGIMVALQAVLDAAPWARRPPMVSLPWRHQIGEQGLRTSSPSIRTMSCPPSTWTSRCPMNSPDRLSNATLSG